MNFIMFFIAVQTLCPLPISRYKNAQVYSLTPWVTKGPIRIYNGFLKNGVFRGSMNKARVAWM